MTGGNKSSQLSIAFTDGDKRMNVSRDTKYPFSGVLEGVGPVFCVEIKNSLMEQAKISTGTTRLVEIYRRISAGTLVQSFHGIWEHERKTYYVMEDLRNELTIAAALTTNRLPDRLARLRFAYDVANTVAYFHSVGLLIKVITDETVVIRTLEGNEVRPCLANIETARTFMEPTAMTSYDVRFEAAEYQRQRMHTKYTDIWRQVNSASNSSSDHRTVWHPDKAFIRQRLADGSLPWGDQQREDGSDDIYAIVGECWNASPALRPSASYVAQTLLEIVARHTAKTPERDPIVSPEHKQRVLEVIRASRDGKRGEHIAMGSVVALRRSVERDMDPVSSFLLGAAIWYELPPGGVHEYEDPESFSIQPREVKRAREALQYLEGAVDAGIDEAHKETALAYASLARHYLHASKNTDI
ncbi:hypothetical protein BD410DRAFT_843728 [Rickenella mellea]|uniref:Protein kinase domain-containing protein n=1 Tax=Rickenella mellea TaxID=50990 RepID=A0A4Y7PPB7_9AGAM|nr:hypothetical protein BD410DRAFT_843728 [Rickenella mellea]